MTFALYNVTAARLLPLLRDEVMEFAMLTSGRAAAGSVHRLETGITAALRGGPTGWVEQAQAAAARGRSERSQCAEPVRNEYHHQ